MEKPAPVFDRYPQYCKKEPRYSEWMIARGIPVVSDRSVDSDKPVWRGDHSFSSDAAAYSLMHFIEPEIAGEHPDWGIDEVKTEARVRFTRRLAQDLSYEKRESSHEETVVRWKPVEMPDGSMELATEYGDSVVTLRKLWEHTKEYAAFVGNPAAYNLEEERAQLAMQDEFIHGSFTGFVSVLSHPDSVRYVQVWEKASDGDVVSKQVDLFAATGVDFSREEGEKLVQHIANYYKDVVPEVQSDITDYAHIFIENSTVNVRDIRVIAFGIVMVREDVGISTRAIEKRVVPDTATSMMVLGTFLRDQISEKLHLLEPDNHVEISKNHIVIPIPEQRINKMEKKIEKKMQETRLLSASADRPKPDAIKPVLAEWFISQTMIRHVKDVPVAPHAALYWFTVLEHRDKRRTATIQATKEKPQRVLVVKRFFSVIAERFLREPVSRIRLPVAAKEIVPHDKKEKMIPVMKLKETVKRLVSGLHHRLTEIIQMPLHRKKTERSSIHKSPKQTELVPQLSEKESKEILVRQIQRACQVWYSDQVHDVPHLLHRILSLVKERTDMTLRHEHDSPAWVLLGIIRYLALLRESGHAGSGVTAVGVRAKRKRSQRVRGLSIAAFMLRKQTRTIIFTFAS